MRAATYLSTSVLALGLAMTATPVAAQEQASEVQETGLRTIVVTAQRREESLQEVPVAVSALDAEALSQGAIDDLRDFAGRVPGLVVDPVNAGPSAAAISIRGISFEDIEKSFDPAVGVVVDGVFIGTNTGQLLDAFDLESIEILRGPQGTLFGRNTIGGVINVQRSKPTGEFGVRASLGYAEYNTTRGRLVVNTPMIGNFLALKGFFFYDNTDGYLRNATLNRRQPNYEIWTAGLTALITPTDDIEAVITYERIEEDGEVATASLSNNTDLICLQVPVPGLGLIRAFQIPDNQCNRTPVNSRLLYTVFGNIEQPVRNKTDAISGTINVELGNFTLTSVTGWRKNDESVRQDFDSASINFFDTLRVQRYEQFTQEVRIAGDVNSWLNLLLGAFYFDSQYQLTQTTNIGFVPVVRTQRTTGDSKSYAAFADAQIKLSDRMTLGIGGRYTRDEKALTTNFGLNADGSCPTQLGITVPQCSGAEDFGEFTYRASLDYKFDGGQMVYASYSRGFRSGGFNGRTATPTAIGPYQPEIVDAYEIGLKADWLDRRLRTNIALFQTDYSDKQEELVRPTPPPFNVINAQETIVENAASARIKGVELEIVAVPSDNLSFNFSATYLDANYRNFVRAGRDVSDLDLRRAPKYSWSAGFDYTRPVGDGEFQWNTIFRFIDKYTTCIVADPVLLAQNVVTNDRRCLSAERELLDSTMSYKHDFGGAEVTFSVFGRNLLDNRGLSSTLPVAGLFTFAGVRPPRQFGAEIMVQF
ncbi:TonB-dependent receptor [Blastomonas sp.]|uniref:TonB-dependent receptor n=1 Tax=Blastomonas sp. TaxID=1909299 RepID=UPI003593E942